MKSATRFLAIWGAMLTTLAWVPTLFAQSPANRHFFKADIRTVESPGDPSGLIVRQRQGVLATALPLTPENLESFTFNLFDDTAFELSPTTRDVRSTNSFSMYGSIRNQPGSSFVLAAEDESIVANFWLADGTHYQLRSIGAGDVLIAQEIRTQQFKPCAVEGQHRVNSQEPWPAAKSTQLNGACPPLVEVLIVHTAQARVSAGGPNAIRALANACAASTNLSFANSGIAVRCRLVHVAEVQYAETNDFALDLFRLRVANDGHLDDVQALREAHGADVVCLLVASSSTCGVTFVMSNPTPLFESLAYTVVSAGCAVGNLSFAHELGHLFGCDHNHGESNGGAFPFAYGHRFFGSSGLQWRTVMSSAPGLRIGHFSNPDIFYDGVPTGVSDGQPDPADNARCIDSTAPIVTAFRFAGDIDCNGNGLDDACDIGSGVSSDLNENSVPDECDSPPCDVTRSTFLRAQTPRASDNFGVALAVAREVDRLVIGSSAADDRGFNSGAADLFLRVNGEWVHEARIAASDGFAFQQFGQSVAISADGQWVAVGAPRDGVLISDIGAAYIFHLENQRWVQAAKLVAPDAVQGDFAGMSVSISSDGSRVAMGAPFQDEGGPQSGAVYVFRRDLQWSLEEKIIAIDASPNSEFGHSLSMNDAGSTLLIGARSDDLAGQNAGAAYIAVRSGFEWTHQRRLAAEGINPGDRFGTSVALAGNGQIAVVGAPRHDGAGLDSGAVWVFQLQEDSWPQHGRIAAQDAGPGRWFGMSTAISHDGQTIHVGSPYDITTFLPPYDGVMSGASHVLVRQNDVWRATGKMATINYASNDNAGMAVALGSTNDSEIFGVVSATLDDHSGEVDAGSVRVIELLNILPDCNGNGLADACDLSNGLSIDSNSNGVPDECEPASCRADVANGDRVVNIDDLQAVIMHWGVCPLPCSMQFCPADVDSNCIVDIDDLVSVIAHWGPCPAR